MSQIYQKSTVLIAEDDYLLAEALKCSLEPQYQVRAVVNDGAAAVRAVREQPPDLVLLDISMPVLNGFEAAQQIRGSHPSVKIIFVTSYADRAYVEEAFRCGAHGYVVKGRLADLHEAIQAALHAGRV